MAEHLARIIGTEEDRVNCPFYWKIGACRHGDQCSRSHYKPSASQSIIIRHMYQNPPVGVAIAEGQQVSDDLLDQAADHFEQFFAEVFKELSHYGPIEDMVVCDNIGDHIIGNVYVKYSDEDAASRALEMLSGRFYGGKQIQAEYTPVTDFREARCRQFVEGSCKRGGYCNFMHMKHVPRSLKRRLIAEMFEEYPNYVNSWKVKEGEKGGSSSGRGGSLGAHNGAKDGEGAMPDHRKWERGDTGDRADRGVDGGRDRRDYRSERGGGNGDRRDYRDRSRDRYGDARGRGRDNRRYGRRRAEDNEAPGAIDHRSRSASREIPVRQSSEERRAMIARWNDERDKKEEAKQANGRE